MLSALKEFLSLTASGNPDNVPVSILRQINSIPRLSDCFPYVGWIPDAECFILDGSVYDTSRKHYIGFALELLPQVGASESMENVLHNILLSLPVDSGLQVTLFASPDIYPMLRRQYDLVASDGPAVFKELYRLRARYYLGATSKSLFRASSYLLRDFRCVLSIVLPYSPFEAPELDQALHCRESIQAILKSAYLPNWRWSPDDLLRFASYFLDPRAIYAPAQFTVAPYQPHMILRHQLRNPEITLALQPYELRLQAMDQAQMALRTYSVKGYPEEFSLSAMSALIGDAFQQALAYPCPFAITIGCITQDTESARNKAYLRSARATQMAESVFAKWQPELRERKLQWDHVIRTFSEGGSLIRLYHQIVLLCQPDLIARAENSTKSIWQARGFTLINDFYFQHQALTAALPMTLTPALQNDIGVLMRYHTLTTMNAVSLSPLIAEWKGTPTPVMTLFGRRGQIMGFDLFDNQGGNYNFGVAALSGSGKSVLVNEMTMRYLACGTKVWIIDVGRSYQNLCSILGGSFIEFTQDAAICINPFSMVIDINMDMEMILPLIAQMAFPRGGITDYEYALLGNYIKDVWDAKQNDATITDLWDHIQAQIAGACGDLARDLNRLLVALQPYTAHGVYASYFNGPANIDFSNDFVVLELEELKSRKDLQSIVLQIIMYRITQEMYLDRSRRKLVIIDEAWDLLGSNTSASFIEAGYRRARKYRGSFGMITQSIDDFYKNAAGRAAIDNADWLFLLRQKPENIDRIQKEGKLHIDEFLRRLLNSVSTEHGMYSEIFVSGPMGSGVGRLLLDPFTMLLYSTRAEDFEAIRSYQARGLDIVDAIKQVLQDRGGEWDEI